MKSALTIFVSFFTLVLTYGQITSTKVSSKTELTNNETAHNPYDSLENSLDKDVFRYIGQELYVNGMSEGLRKYGYRGFVNNYNDKNLNSETRYEKVFGKYFIVLEVVSNPNDATQFYLKLQEKGKTNIQYYLYSTKYKSSFPFIVTGYFIKQKQIHIGKEFIVKGKNWIDKGAMTDIKTGKPVSNFELGAKWKCIDVTVEERFYTLSLILRNEKGEQIPLGIDRLKTPLYVIENSKPTNIDIETWQLIVSGNVKIGMTKEACLLSWGKPKSINQTITDGKKTEQWVYDDNYLYFDNNTLTTIQK